jgi:flagellar L-ring protein FlgH
MNKALGLLALLAFSMGMADTRTFSLYGDKKAKKIDDVITVLVLEDAQALNKTKTGTTNTTNVDLQTSAGNQGLMRFLPNWGFSGKNNVDFKGDGETSRQGQLKAKVTARVVEVHDNGNLLIQGSKMVEINDEKETIHVSGIIRPEDIGADNTILSYNIADAKITYTGDGVNNEAQRPGIFTRFFTWLF